RRERFREAFGGVDPENVAGYGESELDGLLADAGIIRQRGKSEACINNAARVLALRDDGGRDSFISSFNPADTARPRTRPEIPTAGPESAALSRALKRRGFRFVGPTTMYALMEAIGMVDTHLLDSHRRGASGVWSA